MPKSFSFSFFFPAYNEEANIAESVAQAKQVLEPLSKQYEIIIVDDGSRDKTGAIADALAKKDSHVRVVHHGQNQGYGAAVWSGIQAAKYDYVFFTDADLQFDLSEFKKLVAFIPQYEVVIGYRAKRRDPLMRLLNAKGWGLLNRFVFGLRVKDVDCAFKLFKRSVVVDLPVQSRGAMMSAELLIRLQREGIKFKEVPVTHLPRRRGSPTGAKPAVIVRAFREMAQTYRGDLGNVTYRQLVKFVVAGAINTVIDFLFYVALTRLSPYFGHHLEGAKTISFLVGSLSSLLLNRLWTFRKTTAWHLAEVVRFYTMILIALVINIVSLFVFLRLFPFHDIPAVIAATIVTSAWNFIVSKFWVFTHHAPGTRQSTPWIDWLLLTLMAGGTIVGTVVWLHVDTYPPHWDMAAHLTKSLTYTDAFTAILKSTGTREMVHHTYHFLIGLETYYPPFGYWLSVPFILLLGRNEHAAILSTSIWAIIGTLAMYGIGRKLWNRPTGLLAALVFLAYPFIASQFHEFQLDMPLSVMTAVTFWCLLQTDGWRKPGWSLLFGVICGLGMLTKWPLTGFLLGPVVYTLVGRVSDIVRQPVNERSITARHLVLNLLVAGLGLLIAAGPWYLVHLASIRANLTINWNTGTGEGDPNIWTWTSFAYYFNVLVTAQVRLLMLIPLAIGLITTFVNRRNLQRNGLVLAWVIGGYLVMAFYNNKDYRFIEPILGGLAVLSVFWISRIVQPWRSVATTAVVLIAVFQFLGTSWGPIVFPHLPDEYDVKIGTMTIPVWHFVGYTAGAPRQQDWQQLTLLHTIMTDFKPTPAHPIAQVAMYYQDSMAFNRDNMNYYVAQRQLPVRILDAPPAVFNCSNTDYIIAKSTNGIADSVYHDFPYYDSYAYYGGASYNDPNAPKLTGRLAQPKCDLKPMYTSTLPDNSTVYIWKILPR